MHQRMRGKLVYPYSDTLLDYEFSQEHPLKPERLKLTYLLSEQLGLLDKVNVIEPTPATRTDLELFHSVEFIDSVQKCGEELSSDYQHGIGTPDNPIFPKIYETGAKYVGATLDAMKRIIDGASNAFCISGGLHHAHRSAASGFCIFNDVAIAINHLQKKKDCKVLYLDIDAHHGDGVQNAFYRSKDVMTISIHQTGKTLFPGTGFVYETGGAEGTGYAVNVPVIPGAGSLELIKVHDEIVIPLGQCMILIIDQEFGPALNDLVQRFVFFRNWLWSGHLFLNELRIAGSKAAPAERLLVSVNLDAVQLYGASNRFQ